MKSIRRYVLGALVTGFIIIVPVYLSILLLLKAMSSVRGLVKPLALLVPDWLPGEDLIALLLVLILCIVVGMIVRTRAGRAVRERIERSLFERIPGYALLRSLTQRLVGEDRENVWKPALAEIEEHQDGFTRWDTQFSDWNAAKMGPKIDVIGRLEKAIRKQGMRFSVALHHAENWWFYPHRRREFDSSDLRYAGLYGEAHDLEGKVGKTFFEQSRPSKRGYLLLNVGPKPDGTLPDEAQELLRGMGNSLAVNSEAVYGTTHWITHGEGPTQIKEAGTFNENEKPGGSLLNDW